jgi:hypothetical protein
VLHDLKLSRRLNAVKLSWAAIRFRWLQGEKNQLFKYRLCSRHRGTGFSSLVTRTELILETMVNSPFNHLTRLVAPESFIAQKYTCRHFTVYNTS